MEQWHNETEINGTMQQWNNGTGTMEQWNWNNGTME